MTDPWVAISYGALDVTHTEVVEDPSVELVILPTQPSEPIGLQGEVAALWRQLVEGPVADHTLSPAQQALLLEFEQAGVASRDLQHPARITSVPTPWLISPLHELVYALVASIARDLGVELVFIKGPALQRQGIRKREHSGDVDLWADPDRIDVLSAVLMECGLAP